MVAAGHIQKNDEVSRFGTRAFPYYERGLFSMWFGSLDYRESLWKSQAGGVGRD